MWWLVFRSTIKSHYLLKIIFILILMGVWVAFGCYFEDLSHTDRCQTCQVAVFLQNLRTFTSRTCSTVGALSFFSSFTGHTAAMLFLFFGISLLSALCDTLLSQFQLSITMMPEESQSWVFRWGTRYTYLRRLKVSVEFQRVLTCPPTLSYSVFTLALNT